MQVAMKYPVVEVNDVYKSFKDVHAIRGISLKIFPGEFLAILGPNGAGKTTLVEMVEGIQKPDRGDILIKGLPWKQAHRDQIIKILGISLQETWFIEKLTVKETLALFASFYHLPAPRVGEMLELVDLAEKQKAYVKNLSGGQRQRLALALSLINSPEILLLDEPTTGLDPNARREIWNILVRLKNEKRTSLVLTTHYMEEAQFLCDRIIIIDKGKVLARGTLDELLGNCGSSEIIDVSFDGSAHFMMERLPGVQKVSGNGEGYRVEVDKITETLPALLKKIDTDNLVVKKLECRQVTLDDLFVSMTGRRLED